MILTPEWQCELKVDLKFCLVHLIARKKHWKEIVSQVSIVLHDTFGGKDEGVDPLEGWDEANLTEFLRCTVGSAEDFAADFDAMTPDERAERFPDPFVAELVEVWAHSGRERS